MLLHLPASCTSRGLQVHNPCVIIDQRRSLPCYPPGKSPMKRLRQKQPVFSLCIQFITNIQTRNVGDIRVPLATVQRNLFILYEVLIVQLLTICIQPDIVRLLFHIHRTNYFLSTHPIRYTRTQSWSRVPNYSGYGSWITTTHQEQLISFITIHRSWGASPESGT